MMSCKLAKEHQSLAHYDTELESDGNENNRPEMRLGYSKTGTTRT